MIKIVSFDIGNTLIKASKEKGISALLKEESTINAMEFKEAYIKHFILRSITIDSFCYQTGISCLKVKQILNEFYSKKKFLEIWEEVPFVLKRLKELNIRLIAVSNKSYCNPNNLMTYGLQEFFDREIYSCDVGFAKPDTRIFSTAIKGMNCNEKEILHVGDSYRSDYLGAINAGWRALLLDRNENSSEFLYDEICKIPSLYNIFSYI